MIIHRKAAGRVSIMLAAILSVNMIGAHTVSQNVETVSSQSSNSIEITKVDSDSEIKTEELFFGGNDNDYEPVLGACAQESTESECTPLMSKIATDYVEPKTKLETASSPSREIEFDIRVYTSEEIAANKLTPYKIPQNIFPITYYTDNMIDAVATPPCPEFMNDDDVYSMARIIHAEICVLGDEARRCVGTVILNRAWNNGQTINEVIYAPSQFSTAYTSLVPCDECLSAAYDVIYNGYRSFPHYVDSFQCKWDGYFSGHRTYMAFNDGRYKTYFSYSKRKQIITES